MRNPVRFFAAVPVLIASDVTRIAADATRAVGFLIAGVSRGERYRY
jgi:hypothetical protein